MLPAAILLLVAGICHTVAAHLPMVGKPMHDLLVASIVLSTVALFFLLYMIPFMFIMQNEPSTDLPSLSGIPLVLTAVWIIASSSKLLMVAERVLDSGAAAAMKRDEQPSASCCAPGPQPFMVVQS